eukprot:418011_1
MGNTTSDNTIHYKEMTMEQKLSVYESRDVYIQCLSAGGKYLYVPKSKWVYLTSSKSKANSWVMTLTGDNKAVFRAGYGSGGYLSYRDATGSVKIYSKPLEWELDRNSFYGKTEIYSTLHRQNMGYWKGHENELFVRNTFNKKERYLAKFSIIAAS